MVLNAAVIFIKFNTFSFVRLLITVNILLQYLDFNSINIMLFLV